jgi:hypothetical protein
VFYCLLDFGLSVMLLLFCSKKLAYQSDSEGADDDSDVENENVNCTPVEG